MYLKQLDLQGFKSFPEKVKLEFNKGITTVVGPNGSGKSNVSDAVRWVLGEQRAKSLRGDKMEDVIFAGTTGRKPLGFAEVSITIDNTDKRMPLEYSEIKVTRTVYRSGESRYMINGTICRLKDVHELFMDTGVGREGYSIIGQGRIDEILSSKSEDRRRLFEEAAGIVKYRNRRLEAMGKLEKEQQNLLRVQDIIDELELKIEPLREQSAVAKEYLALKEKLKRYEVNNFCIQADKIEKSMAEYRQNIEIAAANIAGEKELYEAVKTQMGENKLKEEKYLKELQKLNDDISHISASMEKTEGEIKLCLQNIEHIRLNSTRLEEEQKAKENRIEEFINELSLFESKCTAIDLNIAALKDALDKEEEQFQNISGVLLKEEEKIESYKAETIEKIKESTDIKSKIAHLELMEEQFADRLEQIVRESDYAQSQIHDVKTRLSVIHKLSQEKSAAQESFSQDLEGIARDKTGLSAAIEGDKNVFSTKTAQLNESRSKLNVLEEMKNDFDGYYKSVKSILKLRGSKGFEGICGAVGEVISVEKRFETAIEITLGQGVQNIITQTEQDAKEAIGYLKKNNLGRSTFLPLSAVKGRDITDDLNTVRGAKGFIGIAKDLIQYDKQYENIMSNLLGRVIVMDNMDSSLALARATGHRYRIVTLEGDLMNPGGTMTGGSISKKASGIFGRTREIGELKELVYSLEKETNALETAIKSREEEFNQMVLRESGIREEMQQIQLELAALGQEEIQCRASIEEREARLQSSNMEEKNLSEQISSAKNDVFELKARIGVIDGEIQAINSQLENYQGSVQLEKDERDQILNQITQIKVDLSSSEQERNGVMENISRVKREKNAVLKEIEELEVQKSADRAKLAEKEKEIQLLKETMADLRGKRDSFAGFREEMNERFAAIKKEQELLEEQKQTHLETVNKLEGDIFKTETKLEKTAEEKERIYNAIWDEYEITYKMAKEQFDESLSVTEITATTRQIKGEIRALGDVNVNAIEEFREVNERYLFLTTQRDDIQNAEVKLQKIIDDLAQMMQVQFKEQFEIINKNFNAVFKEMFGGGSAYLKMSDESNVLESGIEIIAQPPGKTLQNMMLLSGGERALTAIAILFGILKMKPSPFCVLDEIEAALDEANVKRFANYLKNFSEETQFIVITHRKGTMEVADILYGVTMQEHGVSKVISVKLDEAAGKGDL